MNPSPGYSRRAGIVCHERLQRFSLVVHAPRVRQARAANSHDEDLLGPVDPVRRLEEGHGGRVQARLTGRASASFSAREGFYRRREGEDNCIGSGYE